jgi:hypothetical protein
VKGGENTSCLSFGNVAINGGVGLALCFRQMTQFLTILRMVLLLFSTQRDRTSARVFSTPAWFAISWQCFTMSRVKAWSCLRMTGWRVHSGRFAWLSRPPTLSCPFELTDLIIYLHGWNEVNMTSDNMKAYIRAWLGPHWINLVGG